MSPHPPVLVWRIWPLGTWQATGTHLVIIFSSFSIVFSSILVTGLWFRLHNYGDKRALLVSWGYCPLHGLQYQAVSGRLWVQRDLLDDKVEGLVFTIYHIHNFMDLTTYTHSCKIFNMKIPHCYVWFIMILAQFYWGIDVVAIISMCYHSFTTVLIVNKFITY